MSIRTRCHFISLPTNYKFQEELWVANVQINWLMWIPTRVLIIAVADFLHLALTRIYRLLTAWIVRKRPAVSEKKTSFTITYVTNSRPFSSGKCPYSGNVWMWFDNRSGKELGPLTDADTLSSILSLTPVFCVLFFSSLLMPIPHLLRSDLLYIITFWLTVTVNNSRLSLPIIITHIANMKCVNLGHKSIMNLPSTKWALGGGGMCGCASVYEHACLCVDMNYIQY